ncbi:MAG: hypothetical protein RR219_07635, partial [Clostridiales bacterium]
MRDFFKNKKKNIAPQPQEQLYAVFIQSNDRIYHLDKECAGVGCITINNKIARCQARKPCQLCAKNRPAYNAPIISPEENTKAYTHTPKPPLTPPPAIANKENTATADSNINTPLSPLNAQADLGVNPTLEPSPKLENLDMPPLAQEAAAKNPQMELNDIIAPKEQAIPSVILNNEINSDNGIASDNITIAENNSENSNIEEKNSLIQDIKKEDIEKLSPLPTENIEDEKPLSWESLKEMPLNPSTEEVAEKIVSDEGEISANISENIEDEKPLSWESLKVMPLNPNTEEVAEKIVSDEGEISANISENIEDEKPSVSPLIFTSTQATAMAEENITNTETPTPNPIIAPISSSISTDENDLNPKNQGTNIPILTRVPLTPLLETQEPLTEYHHTEPKKPKKTGKTQNLVFGKLDKVSIVGIAIFTLTILVIIANF